MNSNLLQRVACFVLWLTAFGSLAQQAKLSELPPAYQALLQKQGAHSTYLAPDQNNLVVAHYSQYTRQVRSAESVFNAAGRKLNTQVAMDEKSDKFAMLTLINLRNQEQHPIAIPEAEILDLVWSPDSQTIALAVLEQNSISLWRYQMASRALSRWTDIALSAQFSTYNIVWLPDSKSVIVRQSLMADSDAAISAPVSVVKDSQQVPKSRVYPGLLDSPEKRKRLAELALQLAVLVDAKGKITTLTSPLLLEHISVSPDGRYLLTQAIHDDMDGDVKFSRLAREYAVFSIAEGKLVAQPPLKTAAHGLARFRDSAPDGARNLGWLPSQPATLMWVEALDGGDMEKHTPFRDSIKTWQAPFQTAPTIAWKTDWRVFQLFATHQGRAVFSDWKAQDKQLRLWNLSQIINTGDEQITPQKLHQYSYIDKYADPGDMRHRRHAQGYDYLVSDAENRIFLFGEGQTEQGKRPFVTAYDEALVSERVFQSSADALQNPYYFMQTSGGSRVLYSSESATHPPRLVLSGKQAQATIYQQQPILGDQDIELQYLSFQRADGVQLSGDLYIPSTSTEEKLPAVVWLYPREYKANQKQRRTSDENHYLSIDPMGPLVALLEGVAVFDGSNIPIVSINDLPPNDSFTEQQLSNAEAILEALAKTNKIDTSRVMLMGHSYGAFSAINLLANSDKFIGAIARSGAYNRTLTPLGFQNENRNLWQAKDTYLAMSPIFNAHRIDAPVLLVHGEADINPGTSPLQSEMLFEALQVNGGSARLVLLAGEGHYYQREQSIIELLVQQRQWLRKWLYNEKQVAENHNKGGTGRSDS